MMIKHWLLNLTFSITLPNMAAANNMRPFFPLFRSLWGACENDGDNGMPAWLYSGVGRLPGPNTVIDEVMDLYGTAIVIGQATTPQALIQRVLDEKLKDFPHDDDAQIFRLLLATVDMESPYRAEQVDDKHIFVDPTFLFYHIDWGRTS